MKKVRNLLGKLQDFCGKWYVLCTLMAMTAMLHLTVLISNQQTLLYTIISFVLFVLASSSSFFAYKERRNDPNLFISRLFFYVYWFIYVMKSAWVNGEILSYLVLVILVPLIYFTVLSLKSKDNKLVT